ncbi:STAS domain-containing protein [Actinoplanes sp. TRM 88003]|uniref:Anti-sigma factor antagonist n=1 Tax=Paractinoplanes aksuensis TaxID=2939490 RepID=A0ABT1E2Y1_9ACTN|nr:STAS domain-containing protein [Actinoplanes aksuensis]MCO8277402.1 STAS domain-containing protein [Actinoplanes aksuensis]
MDSSITRSLDADGSAVVTVVGEIDFSNADELAGCVREAVTEWSPATVRVDLRSATFIDSTGLGALIEGYRAAGEIEARFLVVDPTPAFRRVLDVTGLCDFFGLGDVVEAEQTRATGA